MANTVNYFSKYIDMLDRVNKANSATIDLEATPDSVKFSAENAKTVYLQKITVPGLGAYDRDTGYNSGDCTIEWESHQMGQDRSKKLKIDQIDMKEAMVAAATLGSEFQRRSVTPEIDAYRFEKICTLAGINATATLTYDTVIAAIRTGIQTLKEAEVMNEGRILYISPEIEQLMEDSGEFYKSINVTANNNIIDTQIKEFNGMTIKVVPKGRFYDNFDFDNTGFAVNSGGLPLNFIIANKNDIIAVKKYDEFKMIENAYNADYSGTLLCFRIYHELFVMDNKVDNIYVHRRAS